MGDSGSDAGASIHASFRNLHRAAVPGVCGVKKVMCRANLRLLGAFGLIPAAEGISKSRRARDTTLIVPFESKLHTECRIHRFSCTRSACVWTRQDRIPEAKRWSPPAPAPGSESLRAVSMYLTQLQPQSYHSQATGDV